MTYTDNLTPLQERLLKLLVAAWENGGSLTYREMSAKCRVTDHAITERLQSLETKGWLRLDTYRYSLNECALEKYSTKWARRRDFPTIAESPTTLA